MPSLADLLKKPAPAAPAKAKPAPKAVVAPVKAKPAPPAPAPVPAPGKPKAPALAKQKPAPEPEPEVLQQTPVPPDSKPSDPVYPSHGTDSLDPTIDPIPGYPAYGSVVTFCFEVGGHVDKALKADDPRRVLIGNTFDGLVKHHTRGGLLTLQVVVVYEDDGEEHEMQVNVRPYQLRPPLKV